MNRQRHMTAFYLETVLMVIIFMLVIAVLAQVFGQARLQSREAQRQTAAVCLAQNAAEAVAAAGDEQKLVQLLDENGNTVCPSDGTAAVMAYYDSGMQPVKAEDAAKTEGTLRVEVTWEPETSNTGTFVTSGISVYMEGAPDLLYMLNTGVYVPLEKPAQTDAEAAGADGTQTAADTTGTDGTQTAGEQEVAQ